MTTPLILPQIVGPDFAPYWVEDLSETEYHADHTSSSSSRSKKILKSGATFLSQYQDEEEVNEAQHFRFGRALHLAVLEPLKFEALYVREPTFVGLTKEGKESAQSGEAKKKRQEWRDSLGKDTIPLKEKEFQDVQGMINSILRHQDACNALKSGQSEISGYYRDPRTGIKCKIRPDHVNWDSMTIVDIKSCRDSSYDEFMKSIWNYRWDFSMANYKYGIEVISGKKIEEAIFIAIEKQKPYEVAVYRADDIVMSRGLSDYYKAMDRMLECLRTNQWDFQQKSLQTISLPIWALIQ